MSAGRLLAGALGLTALCGCIVAPVKSEYPLLAGADHPAARVEEVKILIFNASNPVWSFANSGKDIWIDGKGVVRLETGQYVELYVPRGSRELKLLHQDVFDFYSTHKITISESESIIEICSTALSNKARVLSKLPDQFNESFTAVNEPPTSYFGLRDKPFFKTRLEIERNRREVQFCGW